MSALGDIYITKQKLQIILDTMENKKMKGISFTVSINDEINKYGQNISCHVSQTKEQREAKKEKFYVGNGKVFWTDGKIVKAEKKEDQTNSGLGQPVDAGGISSNGKNDSFEDLPF